MKELKRIHVLEMFNFTIIHVIIISCLEHI